MVTKNKKNLGGCTLNDDTTQVRDLIEQIFSSQKITELIELI